MEARKDGFRIVPELQVKSVRQAIDQLAVFGFSPDTSSLWQGDGNAARLWRDDQGIALVQMQGEAAHGVIDHVAMRAIDTDAAGRLVVARGGVVDGGVTPDGPLEIAEFWGSGVRYQFFQGPGGARVELCAERGRVLPGDVGLDQALAGHSHIGICCRDIAASARFYAGLGLERVFATTLERPGGAVAVCFLRRGGQMVELYSPPERRGGALVLPGAGLWRGLLFEGAGRAGVFAGPDGERVTLSL